MQQNLESQSRMDRTINASKPLNNAMRIPQYILSTISAAIINILVHHYVVFYTYPSPTLSLTRCGTEVQN